MALASTTTVTTQVPAQSSLVLSQQSDDHKTFSDLIQPHLKDYCPASNLAFNEKIRQLINQGKTIYHFGFGQAPFPVVEEIAEGLKQNVGQNAYLPVQGLLFYGGKI